MRITEEEAGKWLRFDPRRYAGGVRKAAAEVKIYAALWAEEAWINLACSNGSKPFNGGRRWSLPVEVKIQVLIDWEFVDLY